MIILALDASEQACSAAIMTDNQCVERVEIAPRQHAELLLPMIDAVLNESGVKAEQVECIAFTAGPGAFTGLRIAVATVQGLALGWQCPVMPVSTLAALTRGAYRLLSGGEYFLPAMDARMQQIYWGAYKIEQGAPVPLCDDQLDAPEQVHFPLVQGKNWVGVGSGWCYESILLKPDIIQVNVAQHCFARDVAFCAQAALNQGQKPLSGDQALPCYIRETEFKKINQ